MGLDLVAANLNLESFEDYNDLLTEDDMKLIETTSVGNATILKETRRSIIQAKADGMPSKVIALQHGVSINSVNTIWSDFMAENNGDGLAEADEEKFKAGIRKKARRAIISGLDCDRDPYRQAAVGVNVMKGIGDFKTDEGSNTQVNILINSVPAEWKSRYIKSPD